MKNDYIVLLHGIFRTSRHMSKLAKYLESHGYNVLNLNYPSTKQPLEELIDIVWQDICSKIKQQKTVNFIGYSMGGLLVRAILSKHRPAILGRVVLLSPPNKGSEVADFLQNNWLYKKLYGPAGQQLITDQTAIAHLFKDIDYECGIIAGNCSIDPFSSLLINGENDGKVSIESTKLNGMKDHIILGVTHTFFPYNKEVQKQTLHFLEYGFFKKNLY